MKSNPTKFWLQLTYRTSSVHCPPTAPSSSRRSRKPEAGSRKPKAQISKPKSQSPKPITHHSSHSSSSPHLCIGLPRLHDRLDSFRPQWSLFNLSYSSEVFLETGWSVEAKCTVRITFWNAGTREGVCAFLDGWSRVLWPAAARENERNSLLLLSTPSYRSSFNLIRKIKAYLRIFKYLFYSVI